MATPVLKPSSSEKIEKDMLEVLRSGWWGYGPKTKELEVKFAEMVGKKYAIAVNSGTSALDLCLKAYGIKGGELITTPMTFVSDAIVGEWNGMEVTFADIEEESLCLDPKTIKFSQKTNAVIPVNSHGRLANIKGIIDNWKEHYPDLKTPLIIEDCAHSPFVPGVGEYSDIQIYSFQAVKAIPAGDGGMITTDDEHIWNRLKALTWLNVQKTIDRVTEGKYNWDYDIQSSDGIKAYMNDLTAVIVLGQMERKDELLAKRRAVQAVYNEAFKDLSQVKTPPFSYTCQYYTMQVEKRDELIQFLADNEVHTSVHFKPLSEMSYWKKAIKRPLPVTKKVWPKLISLPVYHDLGWVEVERIINLVKEFYK
jgi:dTDP-4-amino-4,6-dideoxygalactose transaminase